jgi:hypothetical protein
MSCKSSRSFVARHELRRIFVAIDVSRELIQNQNQRQRAARIGLRCAVKHAEQRAFELRRELLSHQLIERSLLTGTGGQKPSMLHILAGIARKPKLQNLFNIHAVGKSNSINHWYLSRNVITRIAAACSVLGDYRLVADGFATNIANATGDIRIRVTLQNSKFVCD